MSKVGHLKRRGAVERTAGATRVGKPRHPAWRRGLLVLGSVMAAVAIAGCGGSSGKKGASGTAAATTSASTAAQTATSAQTDTTASSAASSEPAAPRNTVAAATSICNKANTAISGETPEIETPQGLLAMAIHRAAVEQAAVAQLRKVRLSGKDGELLRFVITLWEQRVKNLQELKASAQAGDMKGAERTVQDAERIARRLVVITKGKPLDPCGHID